MRKKKYSVWREGGVQFVSLVWREGEMHFCVFGVEGWGGRFYVLYNTYAGPPGGRGVVAQVSFFGSRCLIWSC